METAVVTIGKVKYKIRTSDEVFFDILALLSGEWVDGTEEERLAAALIIFYIDYDKIPKEIHEEALEKMMEFLEEKVCLHKDPSNGFFERQIKENRPG